MGNENLKAGDRVVITAADERYFEVGDFATLSWADNDGGWWANFYARSWTPDPEDNEFCLQKGFSEFELVNAGAIDHRSSDIYHWAQRKIGAA